MYGRGLRRLAGNPGRRSLCVRIPHTPPRGPQAMSEMPKRWLQLHLSTLIVLSFVAGGLLWLNMLHYAYFNKLADQEIRQGWPMMFRYQVYGELFDMKFDMKFINWTGLLMDCAVWIAILVAVA